MYKDFTENSTLKDCIGHFTKDDLKMMAEYLEMKGHSRLNKAELLDAVVSRMLEPEVMFYRLSTFDSREISIFEKGVDGIYEYADDEFETLCTFNETNYVFIGNGRYYVPSDVAAVWKKVHDERFNAYIIFYIFFF